MLTSKNTEAPLQLYRIGNNGANQAMKKRLIRKEDTMSLGRNLIPGAALFAAVIGLAACAPPESAQTTQASQTAAASASQDGPVLLQSRDAPGLSGKWPGEYVGQNGFRGQTTLTLTTATAESVNGVFEYRWGSGNYHRHPSKGSITGVIEGGLLKFGSWDLRLERDGEKLTFRTEQKVGGFPSKLRWNKATPPLKSETVGES